MLRPHIRRRDDVPHVALEHNTEVTTRIIDTTVNELLHQVMVGKLGGTHVRSSCRVGHTVTETTAQSGINNYLAKVTSKVFNKTSGIVTNKSHSSMLIDVFCGGNMCNVFRKLDNNIEHIECTYA